MLHSVRFSAFQNFAFQTLGYGKTLDRPKYSFRTVPI